MFTQRQDTTTPLWFQTGTWCTLLYGDGLTTVCRWCNLGLLPCCSDLLMLVPAFLASSTTVWVDGRVHNCFFGKALLNWHHNVGGIYDKPMLSIFHHPTAGPFVLEMTTII